MNAHETLSLFAASALLVHDDLGSVETRWDIDLARGLQSLSSQDEAYYPQVSSVVRAEASAMAGHYELFYCLENFMREMVTSRLLASHGEQWWDKAVPEPVRQNVQKNYERERESGITLRSTEMIDYTTFGELGEIIQQNWDVFSDTFKNKKALVRILSGLNLLRAPIAHCSLLSDDEVVRLRLGLKDLFRLME